MKRSKHLIPVIFCLMAVLVLGTMAVYATGNLEKNGTYSEMELGEVTLDHHFTKVKTGVYKITANGNHINARPVVKNEKGTVLEEDRDYVTEYSTDTRKKPGKYTITVKGTGEYRGTAKLTLIITPAAPSKVSARLSRAAGGYDDAYVYWSASERATGYNVYGRRTSGDGKWEHYGRTTDTDYLKKNLSDGRTYEFRVVPYITRDDIRYSSSKYRTAKVTTLKKVSRPSAEKYNSEKVRVRWKNIAGESGYEISRSESKTKVHYAGRVTTSRGTSAVVKAVKGKGYYYRVRAFRTSGDKRITAPWSDPVYYRMR